MHLICLFRQLAAISKGSQNNNIGQHLSSASFFNLPPASPLAISVGIHPRNMRHRRVSSILKRRAWPLRLSPVCAFHPDPVLWSLHSSDALVCVFDSFGVKEIPKDSAIVSHQNVWPAAEPSKSSDATEWKCQLWSSCAWCFRRMTSGITCRCSTYSRTKLHWNFSASVTYPEPATNAANWSFVTGYLSIRNDLSQEREEYGKSHNSLKSG